MFDHVSGIEDEIGLDALFQIAEHSAKLRRQLWRVIQYGQQSRWNLPRS